eukprot:COSAG03_NODE_78_length_14126_cov_12.984886_2_plen_42_part_00
MKWLATVDNGTSIETCPYFVRATSLVAALESLMPISYVAMQ